MMGAMEAPEATEALTGLLGSARPTTLELIVRALGARGNESALKSLMPFLENQNERVRVAALETLGTLGGAAIAPTLAHAAATKEGYEQQVARASLQRLRGDEETNRLLVAELSAGDAPVKAEIVHALANRGAMNVVNPAIRLSRADNEALRRESIRALGLLAGKAQLPDMIGLAVAPKTGADLPAIESAIGSVFSRIPSAADRATPVMAALGGASPDGKTVLIRMMSKAATPDSEHGAHRAEERKWHIA